MRLEFSRLAQQFHSGTFRRGGIHFRAFLHRQFPHILPHRADRPQDTLPLELVRSRLGIRNSGKKVSISNCWRRGWESNPRIKVLQTSPLPLGYRASILNYIENLLNVSGQSARFYTIVARKASFPARKRFRPNSFFNGFFDLRFPQESRRLFGGRRVDVEAGAPFEARHLG